MAEKRGQYNDEVSAPEIIIPSRLLNYTVNKKLNTKGTKKDTKGTKLKQKH